MFASIHFLKLLPDNLFKWLIWYLTLGQKTSSVYSTLSIHTIFGIIYLVLWARGYKALHSLAPAQQFNLIFCTLNKVPNILNSLKFWEVLCSLWSCFSLITGTFFPSSPPYWKTSTYFSDLPCRSVCPESLPRTPETWLRNLSTCHYFIIIFTAF